MLKIEHVTISALLWTAVAGCTEAPLSSEEIGQNLQELCANGDGVNSAMAALGVATAKELKRWQSGTDFAISNETLVLTSTGKAQCADGRCWNTQAILDLQRAPFGSIKFGNVTFNADNFRSTLVAEWKDQFACDSRPGFQQGSCTAEPHKLTFRSQQPGACDTIFTFDATSPTGAPLRFPSLLQNRLLFVGHPQNPYLAFNSNGSTVSLDPTLGLVEGASTTPGSCFGACVRMSSADISGQCCACSNARGGMGTFTRSTINASAYFCR